MNTKTMSARNVEILRAAFPECSISWGWHKTGHIAPRHGYAAIHPDGRVRFLGATAYESVQGLLREIDARNAATEVQP